jgi:hypothetical protein
MKYYEFEEYPRYWDKARFPVDIQICIEAECFERLELYVADQTQVCVLGHDVWNDDSIIVYVGCTSEWVSERFERRWAT